MYFAFGSGFPFWETAQLFGRCFLIFFFQAKRRKKKSVPRWRGWIESMRIECLDNEALHLPNSYGGTEGAETFA
jgi:hypothetical protein